MAYGYGRSNVVLSFGQDGLAIARVKSNKRWMPIWHVIFFIYVALLIRLIIIADLGPAGYASKLSKLENGTFLERAAASAMAMDPVSQALAIRIRKSFISLNEQFFTGDRSFPG